jgi:hypothetical protein
MTFIKIRPSQRFQGAWQAWEAPGVEPAFTGPKAKQYALDYARGRFGGRAGEIHVYDKAGAAIEETISINERERR